MNRKCLLKGSNPSKIRELYEYGNNLKKKVGENNVYDFSLGNPSAPTPRKYNEELVRLINEDNDLHSYTISAGLIETRNAIAENINKRYGTNYNGKYVYLTCGAASSLAIMFNALIEEGDELIAFAPYFPEYKTISEHANAKFIEIKPDLDTFYPDFDDLNNKINANTKIVIIDSPNNPTGVIYPKEVIVKLANLLKAKEEEYHHPIYLISDEPYRELIYTDDKHEMVTNYYDNSLICYSFSKSLSIAGDRFGYIVINPNCNEKEDLTKAFLGAARGLGYVCAPRIIQEAIVNCLDEVVDTSIYKFNRDYLYNELTKIGYEIIYPSGAFYLFLKSLESGANKFMDKAKEFNLLIVPSDTFGIKGYVRISYCVNKEVVINSIPAFKKLFESYKG